jgi:hypothetical protein
VDVLKKIRAALDREKRHAKAKMSFSDTVYWLALVFSATAAIRLVFVPSTTLALTILTVPPIAVILRQPAREREKATWVAVSILLIVGVYRGLGKDRRDQEEIQKGIARSFETIGNQISSAINDNQRRFAQTMDQFSRTTSELGDIADLERQNLNTTISGLRHTMNTVTGGDSFCYLDLEPVLNNVSMTTAIRVGKYPLRDISALITDRAKMDAAVRALFKTHNPIQTSADEVFAVMNSTEVWQVIPDFSTSTRYIGGYQMTPSDKQSFDILFRAFNGEWIERLEMRRVDGKWVTAMLVETGRKTRPYFFKIDPSYPRVNGHLDVPWPRPVKGKPGWER